MVLTTFRGPSGIHVLKQVGSDFTLSGTLATAPSGCFTGRLLEVMGRAFQNEQICSRLDLLFGAEEVLDQLEKQRQVLPYQYSFRFGPGSVLGGGSGGASGFRIGGEYHGIWGGAGRCYLTRMAIGPDGRGKVVETIDLRDKKRVETDDHGTIKITRRKLKTTLFESFPQLISFLRESKDEELRVLTTDQEPTLMELVRMAAEPGGGDDYAMDKLAEIGAAARAELIVKLGDSKAKKYWTTIVELLLTVFPSPETRRAVEQLLERDTDEERRRIYVLWLSTTAKI